MAAVLSRFLASLFRPKPCRSGRASHMISLKPREDSTSQVPDPCGLSLVNGFEASSSNSGGSSEELVEVILPDHGARRLQIEGDECLARELSACSGTSSSASSPQSEYSGIPSLNSVGIDDKALYETSGRAQDDDEGLAWALSLEDEEAARQEQEDFDMAQALALQDACFDEGTTVAEVRPTLVECSICFEQKPPGDCLQPTRMAPKPEEDDNEPEENEIGCGHWHCLDCLKEYATLKIKEDHLPHIACSMRSEPSDPCLRGFGYWDLVVALGPESEEVAALGRLLAEACMQIQVHCPFQSCGLLLECHPEETRPDSICPYCEGVFCRVCKVGPYHTDQTCEDHQSAKQDDPVHQLARKQNWRQCPRCKHLIERRDGCNYMRCKCGCGFCYKCGVKYVSDSRTQRNEHGKPGCSCALFDFPAEVQRGAAA